MFSYTLPLLLFALGDATRAYPSFATRNGWPLGAKFRDGKKLQAVGIAFGILPGLLIAFLENSWWIALSILPIGYLLGIAITVLVKEWLQVTGPACLAVLVVVGVVAQI